MQYCVLDSKSRREIAKNYFIYVPPAYKKSQIDLVVNTRAVWDTKVKAMMQHQSQIHDIERILKMSAHLPKKENFLVVSR